MIVKIFKGVWFLSLLATVAIFLYVYASLPENIEAGVGNVISRNAVFYSTLVLLATFNASVFVITKFTWGRPDYFLTWYYGLIIFLNLLIIVSLQFLNLYNSQEKFNYTSIGFIIYGSIALVVLWASLWPAFYVLQKLGGKNLASGDTPG